MSDYQKLILLAITSILSFGCEEGSEAIGSGKGGFVVEVDGINQPYNIYNWVDSDYANPKVSGIKVGGNGEGYWVEWDDAGSGFNRSATNCFQMVGETEFDLFKFVFEGKTESEIKDFDLFWDDLITDVCCPEGSVYVGRAYPESSFIASCAF